MGFNDPRVPAAYPALDSAIFSAAGGPALDALILDTIEVSEVPEVACAAPEDIADSAVRLAQMLAVYR